MSSTLVKMQQPTPLYKTSKDQDLSLSVSYYLITI